MIKYPNLASEFVVLTHYARWIPEQNRRENWEEIINRVLSFLKKNVKDVPDKVWTKIKKGMEEFSVMPSMRLVATAGKAAEKNNICLYNCSYLPMEDLKSFSELLFILMHGSGVGFSVEKEYINKLPEVKVQTAIRRDDYIIEDSREGWASAFLFALETWFSGEDVIFNYNKIRPYGTPLKTMGGRASGPKPLMDLLNQVKQILFNAAGRKLTPLECHDICCLIAEKVISGGRRRSAMISFSDLGDEEMRDAKVGQMPAYRYMANNSAVFKEKPSSAEFLREWSTLALSDTGERGIFNYSALQYIDIDRKFSGNERTNPCSEILLKPYEFCNLSEVVIKKDDDISDLVEKVKTATWIGCIQSIFINFPGLRRKWKKNCEEERLIGVSLTGQMDNVDVLTERVLKDLRKVVEKTAKHAAKKLNINVPKSYTCTKPSGTVSQVVDSAAGCHPRYSKYYIRRFRMSKSDPMFMLLKEQGLKYYPENGQTKDNFTTAVFEFPIKAPENCIVRKEWGAIQQLEWYRKIQKNWSTHNVSITVYVKDDEWLKVGSYVLDNWNDIIGVTFFPVDVHKYDLAPYEEITEEKYNEMKSNLPKIDFSKLGQYENVTGDTTKAAQEFACTAGKCEVI